MGMLGREEDAQEAYKEAALVSEGVAAGSFAKALASLKAYDEDLVAKMEEAVRFLQLERGESHKISYPSSAVTPLLQLKTVIVHHLGWDIVTLQVPNLS